MVADVQNVGDLDSSFYDSAAVSGGHWLGITTAIATVLAWGIADALVAQAAISRLLFSMGRDRVLQHILARVNPKYKTPYASTFLVAVELYCTGFCNFWGDGLRGVLFVLCLCT